MSWDIHKIIATGAVIAFYAGVSMFLLGKFLTDILKRPNQSGESDLSDSCEKPVAMTISRPQSKWPRTIEECVQKFGRAPIGIWRTSEFEYVPPLGSTYEFREDGTGCIESNHTYIEFTW